MERENHGTNAYPPLEIYLKALQFSDFLWLKQNDPNRYHKVLAERTRDYLQQALAIWGGVSVINERLGELQPERNKVSDNLEQMLNSEL